ncbi:MAG: DUF2088 domain-containing protein [Clostridiales bacterium]|nr:DUF2088 domain-containing protein [Clostridiales bacterium]
MHTIEIVNKNKTPITDEQLEQAIQKSISKLTLKKVLLVPPDLTRFYSMAGKITKIYYDLLINDCVVDILPALGTHEKMTKEECTIMFGDIPYEKFIVHDWKNDVVKIGEVPADYVFEVSKGLVNKAFDVEINKLLIDKSYDLIISIGQVVPHEVVGMANYSKNIIVGCGGSNMINQSHMLGALYGMERMMGKDYTPVRKVFDYAQTHFLGNMPLFYVLTVTTQNQDSADIHGLYIGNTREAFSKAVRLSQEKNLTYLDKAPKKVVVYLDEKEFKSTWLGNKAVYRTRMAIADEGELIILAPSVKKFGEDLEIDRLIRKYGYIGREKALELVDTKKDIKENLSVAAHLIHGSSDGRFTITYAVDKMTREEIEGVGYKYANYFETIKRYNPKTLVDGINIMDDGEEIFYISNPALGLWAERKKFF